MLTLQEIQAIELEMMHAIHLFCEKHNLMYCMIYGTLLGAVRHQGFIPWDNDVDIGMPRDDFEAFLSSAVNNLGDNYGIVHYSTDPQYHYQVMRVYDKRTMVTPTYIREQPTEMGVWIDIFPVDGVWDENERHPIINAKLWFNQILQRADIYGKKDGKGFGEKIKYILQLLFKNSNNIHEYKIDQYAKMCDYNTHDRVYITVEWDDNNKTPFTKKDFENPVPMKFEKYTFWGPQSWHDHLVHVYGDYMKLPEEKDRIPHDIEARWK